MLFNLTGKLFAGITFRRVLCPASIASLSVNPQCVTTTCRQIQTCSIHQRHQNRVISLLVGEFRSTSIWFFSIHNQISPSWLLFDLPIPTARCRRIPYVSWPLVGNNEHSIHQLRQNSPPKHNLVEDTVSFACVDPIPPFSCSLHMLTLHSLMLTLSNESNLVHRKGGGHWFKVILIFSLLFHCFVAHLLNPCCSFWSFN